jgi:hypothetical protein
LTNGRQLPGSQVCSVNQEKFWVAAQTQSRRTQGCIGCLAWLSCSTIAVVDSHYEY